LTHVPVDLVRTSRMRRGRRVGVARHAVRFNERVSRVTELTLGSGTERRRGRRAAPPGQTRAGAHAEVRLVLVRSGEDVDGVLFPGLEREGEIFRNQIAVDEKTGTARDR